MPSKSAISLAMNTPPKAKSETGKARLGNTSPVGGTVPARLPSCPVQLTSSLIARSVRDSAGVESVARVRAQTVNFVVECVEPVAIGRTDRAELGTLFLCVLLIAALLVISGEKSVFDHITGFARLSPIG